MKEHFIIVFSKKTNKVVKTYESYGKDLVLLINQDSNLDYLNRTHSSSKIKMKTLIFPTGLLTKIKNVDIEKSFDYLIRSKEKADRYIDLLEKDLIKTIKAVCNRYNLSFDSGMGGFIFSSSTGQEKDINLDKIDNKSTTFWNTLKKLTDLIYNLNNLNNFCGGDFKYNSKQI